MSWLVLMALMGGFGKSGSQGRLDSFERSATRGSASSPGSQSDDRDHNRDHDFDFDDNDSDDSAHHEEHYPPLDDSVDFIGPRGILGYAAFGGLFGGVYYLGRASALRVDLHAPSTGPRAALIRRNPGE